MPSIEELSRQFPQLEIVKMIGRGGMGAIYQARQTSLGRNVALKVLTSEVCGEPSFVERFEREARALAMLSHPNIVTVFDFGRTGCGKAFLTMEYIEGANLRQAIGARRLGMDEAIQLMEAIGKAIEYAHSKGVVHRDLKPENILLGEDGTVKVADFGIAKILNDPHRQMTLTGTRQVLGSPHYLAPEQIGAPDQVDHRIDLYALGVIFYELLTGQLPLGLFEPPSSIAPEIDKRLDSIVLKLLHRKPDGRYQTATEFLTELKSLHSSQLAAHPGNTPWNSPRPVSVPFSGEALGGWGESRGILHAETTGLRIEYFTYLSLFSGLKSEVKELFLPKDRLIRMSLSDGLFSCKLKIVTNAMSVVSQLPGGESGHVELTIRRSDRALASQVIRAMGFESESSTNGFQESLDETYSPTHALLMMICGVLNAGALAVIITAIVSMNMAAGVELAIVSVSVIFGLLVIVQLLGGIVHLATGHLAPLRVALLASLFPVTPVVLLSLPIAVWWWLVNQYSSSRRNRQINASGKAGAAHWTATTLIYLRENRTARALSIANVAGILILAAGLGIFMSGWYRSTLRFRTVDTLNGEPAIATSHSVEELIRQRLDDLKGASIMYFPEDKRIEIKSWKRLHPTIVQRLELPQNPRLVLISPDAPAAGDSPSPTDHHQILDLASGLGVPSAYLVGSGNKVQCLTSEMILDDRAVRSLKVGSTDKTGGAEGLLCQWSASGRQVFDQFLQDAMETPADSATARVGMVVDGVVVAIATIDDSANQQLVFTLSDGFCSSTEALMAAIRGPNTGLELEPLP